MRAESSTTSAVVFLCVVLGSLGWAAEEAFQEGAFALFVPFPVIAGLLAVFMIASLRWLSRQRSPRFKLELAVLWLSVLVGIASEFLLYPRPCRLDFIIHRGEFEAIVQDARSMKIDRRDVPTTLWIRGHKVEAMRSPDGKLNVSFSTYDEGHLGDYGYLFSEDDAADPLGNLPFVDGQIADHWWSVYNNLW